MRKEIPAKIDENLLHVSLILQETRILVCVFEDHPLAFNHMQIIKRVDSHAPMSLSFSDPVWLVISLFFIIGRHVGCHSSSQASDETSYLFHSLSTSNKLSKQKPNPRFIVISHQQVGICMHADSSIQNTLSTHSNLSPPPLNTSHQPHLLTNPLLCPLPNLTLIGTNFNADIPLVKASTSLLLAEAVVAGVLGAVEEEKDASSDSSAASPPSSTSSSSSSSESLSVGKRGRRSCETRLAFGEVVDGGESEELGFGFEV